MRLTETLIRFAVCVHWRGRVRTGPPPVKVNVGCGLWVADGWINLDAGLHALFSKWPRLVLKCLYRMSSYRRWYSQEDYMRILRTHRFVHHNVERGLPFLDGSVDFVYSSHLLEHLSPEHAGRLMREAHRVLREGGTLRVCVPDLKHAIDLYLKGRKEDALAYFFTKDAGVLGSHKFMYDFELLAAVLRREGFPQVEQRSFREGVTPDLDKLDNRPEETLYVEARK